MEKFRKSLRDLYTGEKLSITPLAYIIRAVVKALTDYPNFNASLDLKKEKIIEGKIDDIKKPQKQVYSPVLPQSSFSFSGSRLPTFLIAGFVIGFIMFAIIGLSPNAPPYQPPIEMDLGLPTDDYYNDYYYP